MKLFLMLGSISGFLSVALGAFGAHALKEKLDEYSLGIFHTGVTYQTTHALALVLVALLLNGTRILLASFGRAGALQLVR